MRWLSDFSLSAGIKGGALAAALALAGCTQGGGTTPLGDTLLGLWNGASPNHHREQAEALPYASLLLSMQGNQALVVLAYQGGPSGEQTLWQARDHATLELRQGRPFSSAGFEEELLGMTLSPEAAQDEDWPAEYRVHSHWRTADGMEHYATGQASLTCSSPEALPLPLTQLELERCQERVDWHEGSRSRNTLWRHPETRRLWAGDIQPWPGASRIEWQVARPWWSE